MSKRYLILGKGFIGASFAEKLEGSFLSEARINSQLDAELEIIKHNPDVVINCIGKTGRPNIDWCEDNKEETLISNVVVPIFIALACKKLGKKMVHIGSGCVYEGNNNGQGFSEEDEPNFQGSFYSRTKIISEKILKEFENILQIRIRMPVSTETSERNLISKLLSYKNIISIDNSISVIEDVLNATKKLVEKDCSGIFNVVNKGHINHQEILKLYEEIAGKKLSYQIISIDSLHKMTKANRSNTVLSTKKLESLGIEMPNVKDSVRLCLEEYIKKQESLK